MVWPVFLTVALAASPPTPPRIPPGGAALYRLACAYCHGTQGQGNQHAGAPALWGPHSLLLRSAYPTPNALRLFIQHNMPLLPVNGVNPGSLTSAQATSLAQYLWRQNAAPNPRAGEPSGVPHPSPSASRASNS
ncbi:MAG: c-type cytochrome [Firmicutes bacterium]|nr:c-type cytochrome [Bacillota bacterium]